MNWVITRRNITKLLTTRAIQDQVANLAREEEMLQELKITSKIDVVLYDLSWIAGVDYPLEPQEVDNDQDLDEMHPDKMQDWFQRLSKISTKKLSRMI
jgi:hypothetical protein